MHTFEDGREEVEVRIPLPAEIKASDVAKRLSIDIQPSSVKVAWKEGAAAPLLNAPDLYEKIRPSDSAWYIDGSTLVLTLSKQHPQKWPALTDTEALEKRFGPIRTSPDKAAGSAAATASAAAVGNGTAKAGAEQAGAGGGGNAETGKAEGKGGDGAGEKKDGAAAWAAREKVNRLLKAAQDGDVEGLKQAVAVMIADGKAEGDGKGKSVLAVEEAREVLEEVRDANGRTALHFAASKGHVDACRYMVEEIGVPVDVKDDEGETPLMLAARDDHSEAATWLVEHGAAVATSAEKSGAQAIHHAAGHGSVKILELLLDHGADPNAQSDAGPPLLWACGHGKVAAAEVLLTRGANPDTPNEDGVNSLLTATAAGETEIVKLLLKHGAQPNPGAADAGNTPAVSALLAAGADANKRDEDGMTALDAAAAAGNKEVVELLLPVTQRPADVAEGDWTVEGCQLAATGTGGAPRPGRWADESFLPSTPLHHPAPPSPGIGSLPQGRPGRSPSGRQGDEGHSAGQPQRELAAPGTGTPRPGRRADGQITPSTPLHHSKPPLQALDLYPKADLEATPADDRALDMYPKADLPAIPADDRVMKGTLLANRSVSWLRLDQAPLALADGQMSRALRPDWAKAYFREGTAFRAMERYEDAANVFFEGVQVDPNNMDLTAAFQEAIEAGRKAHKEKQGSQS
ncbi:unnamed protein product [Closterium sp. Yama58-4]|nr:unnamed protein product [Closterium sp. Yama58-4]